MNAEKGNLARGGKKNGAKSESAAFTDRSIVLIGMPGVGKTTAGELLARHLSRKFHDTDAILEGVDEMSCAEIINTYGIKGFRSRELAAVQALMYTTKGSVISLGGGAVEHCAKLLRNNTVIVWLKRPLEDIAKDLDSESRPLSTSLDDLSRLYDERKFDYELASDVEVEVARDPGITVKRIIKEITPFLNGMFLVINGPNINMLGIREPDIYGDNDMNALIDALDSYERKRNIAFFHEQTNHEGEIIDMIQKAFHRFDGIVINPGAYAHYSYAIHDAIKSVAAKVPVVEVHISDISTREPWRRSSVTAPACIAQISGHGFNGYLEALDLLRAELKKKKYAL